MQKGMRLLFALFAVAVVLLVPVALVCAQTADPIPMPDWKAQLALAIAAIAPLVNPFIVTGVRRLIPKIPRVALPLVAMGLGFGASALSSYVAGHEFSPLLGAAIGAGTLWVREIVNTFNEHGLVKA